MQSTTTPTVATSQDQSNPVHRSAKYQKVLDGRKQPIRGLWRRNGHFIARITVEEKGRMVTKWFPLGEETNPVDTVPQAVKALAKLRESKEQQTLPVLGRTPKFRDFVSVYF